MRAFSHLMIDLELQKSDEARKVALTEYLKEADDHEAMIALQILLGIRRWQSEKVQAIRSWLLEASGLPEWLIDESHAVSDDWVETATLLMPAAESQLELSLRECIDILHQSDKEKEETRKQRTIDYWLSLDVPDRYCFNNLLMGRRRFRLARHIISRALAEASGRPAWEIDLYLIQCEEFVDGSLSSFLHEITPTFHGPYPFSVPSEHDGTNTTGEWWAQDILNGKRIQVIKDDCGPLFWHDKDLWIHSEYPELSRAANELPGGTVLDGFIVQADSDSHCFVAIDILEFDGTDLRQESLVERNRILKECVGTTACSLLHVAPTALVNTSGDVRDAVVRSSNGLILKKPKSPYVGGINPEWIECARRKSMLCVLQYVRTMRSMGMELTFGVWKGDTLVPCTRFVADLSGDGIAELFEFFSENSTERFGPVRAVAPSMVFEVEYKGVVHSRRHKAGYVLQSPNLLQRRGDVLPEDAASVADLRQVCVTMQSDFTCLDL